MSAKLIPAYRGYTAAAIKARATLPGASDMVVNGTNVECSNIDIVKIANALGISVYDFAGQAASEAVNRWSAFGPTTRTAESYNLVNAAAPPHGLDEWCCYNHSATAPGWQTGGLAEATAEVWIDSGGYATVSARVLVGEVNWSADMSVTGICLALYNSVGNLIGWGALNFEDEEIQSECTVQATVSIGYTGGMVTDETITCKLWLVSDTSEFDDTQQICYLPNTSAFDVDVKIRQATDLIIDDSGGFTIVTPSFNLNAGTCGFNDAYKNADYTNLIITARLFNSNYEPVGNEIELYYDSYAANTQLGALSGKPAGDPVAAYGYHFKLTFYYTI